MRALIALAAGLAAGLALAQSQPGPALSVDAAAGQHSINPGIYGFNWYWGGENDDQSRSGAAVRAAAADLRRTVRRWGGNNTSRYNWRLDVMNIDADWFFEVLPEWNTPGGHPELLPDGSTFNRMIEYTRITGGKMMGTIPLLGWLPNAREKMCSFSVNYYGPQCKVDPWWRECGNGVVYDAACGDAWIQDGKSPANPVNIKNNLTDAAALFDQTYQRDWVKYVVSKYGKGNQGGVEIWSLDNEPIWWNGTHRDIHPDQQTYNETIELGLTYAAAIKEADPTALVSGPVSAGWESFYFSFKDCMSGWTSYGVNGGPDWQYWNNPIDRNAPAHGGLAFVPWYLQQFRDYEQKNGTRLLDILDLHAYIHPPGVDSASAGDTATQALRLQSTRVLWDPNYIASWLANVDQVGSADYGKPVAAALVPRMRRWVDQYYPGTKTAITEYNWGALKTMNGALAQADILGIFGREGLDVATLWPNGSDITLTDPGAFAFKIHRNYDGIGGAFGETGVQASTGDADKLSIFAAQRSDSALTVLVLNKTTGDLSSTLSLSNFTAGGKAQVWRYTQANLGAIVRDPADTDISGNAISATFPAYSMTLFVIPAQLSVPKPVVDAVTNAASYGTQISPGQIVTIFGSNLGPKDLRYIEVGDNGMVKDSLAGARILFDGVPGSIVYVQEKQCAAVVPYLTALKPTTHVQVEYQGARSEPLEVAIAPTGPGLFTINYSGSGQGAIINEDNITVNSPDKPAARGSIVILWGTGEGVTNPPGVEGRLATDILPKPVAQCSVQIGGLPATVEYCGAAPLNMPGLFQINARMDPAVAAGNDVPVKVTIGSVSSQDGVTLAVR